MTSNSISASLHPHLPEFRAWFWSSLIISDLPITKCSLSKSLMLSPGSSLSANDSPPQRAVHLQSNKYKLVACLDSPGRRLGQVQLRDPSCRLWKATQPCNKLWLLATQLPLLRNAATYLLIWRDYIKGNTMSKDVNWSQILGQHFFHVSYWHTICTLGTYSMPRKSKWNENCWTNICFRFAWFIPVIQPGMMCVWAFIASVFKTRSHVWQVVGWEALHDFFVGFFYQLHRLHSSHLHGNGDLPNPWVLWKNNCLG